MYKEYIKSFKNVQDYLNKRSTEMMPLKHLARFGNNVVLYERPKYQGLHFKADAEQTIRFSAPLSATTYWSYDGAEWNTWTDATQPITFGFDDDHNTVYIASLSTTYNGKSIQFGNSTPVSAGGNIMSLIEGGQFNYLSHPSAFSGFFSGCTQLVTAPELPASYGITQYCYYGMFQGCTNLIKAPSELPMDTLEPWCYANMFSGCTSLTAAPEMQAMTLASGCCSNMFSMCFNLTKAPVLYADTCVENCYEKMFYSCTSLSSVTCYCTDHLAPYSTSQWLWNVAPNGEFHCPQDATWSLGESGIPATWTRIPTD